MFCLILQSIKTKFRFLQAGDVLDFLHPSVCFALRMTSDIDVFEASEVAVDGISNLARERLVDFGAELNAVILRKGQERIGCFNLIGTSLLVKSSVTASQLLHILLQSVQYELCLALFLQRPEHVSYCEELVNATYASHFARKRSLSLEGANLVAIVVGDMDCRR